MKERLRAWILAHGHLDGIELDDHTLLLEERVLTSLQVMDLLLFIEELRGAPVDIEQLSGAEFRDLQTLSEAFLHA